MDSDITIAQLLALNLPVSGSPTHGFVGGKNVTVTGTTGNDSLRSGGADTMIGGLGDDTYNVLTAGDVVIEQPGQGIDTVKTNVNFVLGDNLENLTLLGSSGTGKGLYGTGNGLDNRIAGDTGVQFINGAAGNDMLTGGGGADTFIVEKGNGSDLITDFSSDDAVWLQGYGFSSFSAVQAAMTQVGNDVVLQLSPDEALGFRNTQIANFTANQFKLQLDTSDLVQVFGDEFNSFNWYDGTSGTWRTVFKGGASVDSRTLITNGELQIYTDPGFGPNPFSVSNGVLTITATNTAPDQLAAMSNYAYTSGLITSKFSHSQLYGVFEIRAQLPAAAGAWPAFWLIPTDNSAPAEIDVFEQFGATPNAFTTTLHSSQGAAQGQSNQGATAGGFHTYTVDWEPDYITWYFDGNAVFRQATPADMHVPMYVLANMAVGGAYQPAAGAFNAQMQIDYIHASQHGQAILGTGSNDVFTVASIQDIVVEQAGGSNNTVFASIDYMLPANVQTLVLTGSANLSGFANELASSVTGNDGNNLLEGNIGADTLSGGNGNDRLDGLSGNDVLIGGAGNNTLVGNIGIDTATGYDSSWHIAINASNRWIVTDGTNTDILSGVEQVVIAGTTYMLVDTFGGGVSGNGKGGFPTIQQAIDNAPAAGNVVIDIAPGSYADGVLTDGGVNNITLIDYASGQGADVNITGNSLANIITGDSGANVITGGGGADSIDGGAGADTAVFSGNWVDYSINGTGLASDITTLSDNQSGRDGADSITGVESVQFANGTFFVADIINDAPVAADEFGAVTEAGMIRDGSPAPGIPNASGRVLANDIDPDTPLGDTLMVKSVRTGAETSDGTLEFFTGSTVVQGTYGSLTIFADGTYSYDLDNARSATQALTQGAQAKDAFTYQVADAHGLTDLAQITINVTGTYDAPIVPLTSINASTNGSTSVSLASLLASATDADGAPLHITNVALGPTPHGIVQMSGGIITYTPTPGYVGDDSFTYFVDDGVASTQGTVSISVASLGSRFTSGTTGADVIDYTLRTGAQMVNGQGGDDTITGGAGGDALNGSTGNDVLQGNGGADVLTGGSGSDMMTGGSGADSFTYTDISEFGPAGHEDVITDFTRSDGDKIRLTQVDANTIQSGDQSFGFLGNGAFTGHAGELHYVVTGSDLIVAGDVNGDGVADFQFKVLGMTSLQASDFYL